MAHLLDNPAWHALTGEQSAYGTSAGRAARYRASVSPIAAVQDQSNEALLDLAEITPAGEVVALFTPGEIPVDTWQALAEVELTQWVCESPVQADGELDFVQLGAADAQAMFDLARSADPGPFEMETYQLGDYVGIFEDGALVAMAGERICFESYREVSAVATLPGHEGRGYAKALVAEIVRRQHAADCTPFLHVRIGSPAEAAATRVYARLGFVERTRCAMTVLRRR